MSQLLMALAVLGPVLGPSRTSAPARPATECRATLEGSYLVTAFQHAGGYRVEGIWTLLAVKPREFGAGPSEIMTELRLDWVVEWAHGQRVAVPVTMGVRRAALAVDQVDALRRTIGAWCGTVQQALEEGVHLTVPAARAWRRI